MASINAARGVVSKFTDNVLFQPPFSASDQFSSKENFLGDMTKTGGRWALTLFSQQEAPKPDKNSNAIDQSLGLLKEGKAKEAMAILENAIKDDPTNAYLRLYLGVAYLQINDIQKAIDQFKTVSALEPNMGEAHYYLGVSLYQAGKEEEAFAEFKKAYELKPEIEGLTPKLGVMLMQRGELKGAEEVLVKAHELSPDDENISDLLKRLFIRNNNIEGINSLFGPAEKKAPKKAALFAEHAHALYQMGQKKEAMKLWDKAFGLEPKNVDLRSAKANALLDGGDHKEALDEFQKIERISPKNRDAFWGKITAYINLNRNDEASSLLGKEPESVEKYHYLGFIHYKGQEFDKAIDMWKRSAALDEKNAVSRYNLGNAYLQVGDLARAEENFRNAVQLKPDFSPALANLGVVLVRTDKGSEAIEYWKKAKALTPEDSTISYNLGLASLWNEKIAEALGYFKEYSGQSPSDPNGYYFIAKILNQLGNTGEAKKNLELALSKNERHFPSLVEMGYINIVEKNWDAAASALKKAVEIDPKDVHAHDLLARALFENGDKEGAVAEWKKTVILNPSDPVQRVKYAQGLRSVSELKYATEQLRQAIRLDGSNNRARHVLAEVLWEMDLKNDAMMVWQRIIKLDASDWQAHHNLAVALKYFNKANEAIGEFELAKKYHPENADIGADIINFEDNWYVKNYQKVVESLKQVVGDEAIYRNLALAGGSSSAYVYVPAIQQLISSNALIDSPRVLKMFGTACLEGNEPLIAISFFKLAESYYQKDNSFMELYGDALMQLGRYDEAIKKYSAAGSKTKLNNAKEARDSFIKSTNIVGPEQKTVPDRPWWEGEDKFNELMRTR